MTTHPLHAAPSAELLFAVLDVLYTLSPTQARLNAGTLARRLGVAPHEAACALVHLEQRGLADAGRARLTLRGLAVAAALAAQTAAQGVRRVA